MKTNKFFILAPIIFILISTIVFSHPGRLDSNGGHYNRKTGEYHYHDGTHTEGNSSKSSLYDTSNYDYSKEENHNSPVKNTESKDIKKSFSFKEGALVWFIIIFFSIQIICLIYYLFSTLWNKIKSFIKGYFKMIFKSKGQKNIEKLRQTMSEILDIFEAQLTDYTPSCKNVLIDASLPLLQRSIAEAGEWEKDFDYTNTAYCVLYGTAFDLLASGRFHIYRGELNPMNESQHIYKFCIHHLDRATSLGFISEEEKTDQINYLKKCIAEVG